MSQKKGIANSKFINRLGEIHKNNRGELFEIVEYINASDCSIMFIDSWQHIIKNVSYKSIYDGRVKNPYALSVFGKGFYGAGLFSKKHAHIRNRWRGMIGRCYSEKEQEKYPTYKDVTVCEEWHNFQVFAEWMEENYNPETMQGWHLDKDILVKGNKIYSPETCCFVPSEINTLFNSQKEKRGTLPRGVSLIKNCDSYRAQICINGKALYLASSSTPEEAFKIHKKAKESHIKDVADKWKPFIDDRVYQAMYNYQVEITD